MADPRAAAAQLLAAALGEDIPAIATGPEISWAGKYLDPDTGLAARVDAMPNGQATLHFAGHPEILTPTAEGDHAAGDLRLKPEGARLRMIRGTDNIDTLLEPAFGAAPMDVAGTYHSAEYGAAITLVATGGTLYAACSGELGDGAMAPLIPYAADTWLMPCPRSLDFSAPGDWTLSFRRQDGRVAGLRMGCWLARQIDYTLV